MERKNKILDIENTEGASDINRIVALRSYENERMHPTNVRMREDKDNAFKNVKAAYDEGNLEGAAAIYESNKDILDDEYISGKVEAGSKFKKFFSETGKMVGSAIESTLNNVYEVTDDMVRGLEKFGLPNIYFGVEDGEFKIYTQRPENVTTRPFEFVDSPDGMIANMGSGLIEFMIPFKTMLTATKAYKGGNMATNALKVYGSGAVADFMFSPENGNFASLLVELGVQNEFVNWLDSRPENADDLEQKLKARGKQVLEGGIIGVAFDTAIHAMRYMKQSPEWVAKAKSYLSANFAEEPGAALASSGVANTNLSAVSPAVDNVLSDAGSATKTSPTETPSSGTNLPPSQETGTPVSNKTETTSPETDLGYNNNLSAISIKDKVYQADNEINILVTKANELKPTLDNTLSQFGVDYISNVKTMDSITTKLATKNREPKGIPDYLRGMVLPEYQNFREIVAQFEKDVKILDKDYNNKTRSFHYQIEVSAGFTSEVQIRPKEIYQVIEKHHKRWYSLGKKYGKDNPMPMKLKLQIINAELKLEKDLNDILGQ